MDRELNAVLRVIGNRRFKDWIPLVSLTIGFSLLIVCTQLINQFHENTTDVGKVSVLATWNSISSDKWASIWLIQHYINPSIKVFMLPENEYPDGAILFDTPDAFFRSTSNISTFEQLLGNHILVQPEVQWFKHIVHGIDVDLLLPDQKLLPWFVERRYRSFQVEYTYNSITYNCDLALFDNVASTALITWQQRAAMTEQVLSLSNNCGYWALNN